MQVSTGNRPVGVVLVQRGSNGGHANAMRPRSGFRLSLIWLGQRLRLIGPSIQIRWWWWGRRCILLFAVFRQGWLWLKLLESHLVERLSHHSEYLKLAMLPNAVECDSKQRLFNKKNIIFFCSSQNYFFIIIPAATHSAEKLRIKIRTCHFSLMLLSTLESIEFVRYHTGVKIVW